MMPPLGCIVEVLAEIGSRCTYAHDASMWLAEQLGTDITEILGAHALHFDHPRELADWLRPPLRQIS